MTRNLFFGSVALCLLFIGLSQISDPSILGIHGEPEQILYYGGSGLLAGLFGIIALGIGIFLGTTQFEGISKGRRRVILFAMLLVFIAVLIILVIRFYTK
jgi:ABC-type Na+ efflux pump permease subunit